VSQADTNVRFSLAVLHKWCFTAPLHILPTGKKQLLDLLYDEHHGPSRDEGVCGLHPYSVHHASFSTDSLASEATTVEAIRTDSQVSSDSLCSTASVEEIESNPTYASLATRDEGSPEGPPNLRHGSNVSSPPSKYRSLNASAGGPAADDEFQVVMNLFRQLRNRKALWELLQAGVL
jgi:hypothetical protein